MALTPTNIIADVARDLADPNKVRWTQDEHISYLNSALRQIVLVRPDANSVVATVQLAPGTKQAVPSGGLALLDVVRNMGPSGTTPGKPIKRADRAVLDASDPTWHSRTAKTVVSNFSFDERVPTAYYVSPPVHATTQVWAEIMYSKAPTAVTSQNLDTPIELSDVYETPIKDWMKRCAYKKEISSQGSQILAGSFEQSFYNALGIKLRADFASSPNQFPPKGGMNG